MDPITGGLLAGAGNLLGGVFSSITGASNTQQQIAASEQQQATQNQFTEMMSNTAYQRASADMKAAGLNPMMMFGSGGAASTPSGSSIQAPMPQRTSPLGNIGSAVQSTVNTAVQAKTFDKMTEEIANLQAEQARTAAQTRTEEERPELMRQEAERAKQAAWLSQNTAARTQWEIPQERSRGLQAEAISSMPAWLRDNAVRAGFLGGKVSDVLAPITSSVGSIGRAFRSAPTYNTYNRSQTFYGGE